MMQALSNAVDRFFGRGQHSTSVPIMDGPLQPNQRLEAASVLAQAPDLDNLVNVHGVLMASSGKQLLRIVNGRIEQEACFDAAITCLAVSTDGGLAIGLEGQGILLRGGACDGQQITAATLPALCCTTAALFLDAETLIVASGSIQFAASQWKHDLMAHGASGSIWRINLKGGPPQSLAHSLCFPYGLALTHKGKLLVSEAWRHRIVELDLNGHGQPQPVLNDLPAYPSRLIPATDGGYWLALFAPRNALVEFVLREQSYRKRMMTEVDPRYWIAPTLGARASHQVPMQSGGIRQMNILKPWAPSLSYGLVMRLNEQLLPVASWHSRADGTTHGITSLCELGNCLVLSAKGPGRAVLIDPHTCEEQR